VEDLLNFFPLVVVHCLYTIEEAMIMTTTTMVMMMIIIMIAASHHVQSFPSSVGKDGNDRYIGLRKGNVCMTLKISRLTGKWNVLL